MRFQRTSQAITVTAVSALALSACGGGANNSLSGGGGDPAAIVSAYSNEPQSPLLPSQTGEVFGGRVVEQLYSGLRTYDKDGNVINELAESIDTTDNKTYVFKVKTGTTFTNGEPVTAKSFMDTWNFAALSTNNQAGANFFSSIEGYDDVSATEGKGDEAKPAPKAQTMSGLSAPDDATLTVKLKSADPEWPQRLGYTGYYPLPSEALKDPKKYGQSPVGNGPYKLKSEDAWQHDKSISLVKNDDYTGPRQAKNGGLNFMFYTSPEPAYTDIQGDTLDVTDVIPSNAIKTFEQDLGGRSLNKPSSNTSNVVVPSYLPQFQGEAGKLRKQAISMAIDREAIAKTIFNDTVQAAKNYAPSGIPGYTEDIPGSEVFQHEPEKAKELWAKAEALSPWNSSTPFTVAYNTDGGNKEWVDAMTNQITSTLGIPAEGKPYPKFAALLDDRLNKTLTGAVRAGWQADYPSLYNFLEPLYGTGGSANYEGYSSPEVDALLKAGLNASTDEQRHAKYNEAQAKLFEDLPAIALWDRNTQAGWSSKVSNVSLDWRGVIRYGEITKQG